MLNIFRLKKMKRQFIYAVTIILFIGINFFLAGFSLRLDLSNGAAYTLSPATKKILKNLNSVVDIKFFASSDIPARLLPLKTDVVDLLAEYRQSGGGKINIQVLDPKTNSGAASQAADAGVPQIQFSQLEQDKYAVTSSYFGIALSYSKKKDVIPQVTNFSSLEYNLTSAIYKLSRKELVKVGTIGEPAPDVQGNSQLTNLTQLLSQQFTVDPLDISSSSAVIDPSYKTVLIFDDGQKSYSDNELSAIKSYLDQGGKAVFFVDGVSVDPSMQVTPSKSNLLPLIGDWGAGIENDLVLSSSAELVNFGNIRVSFLAPYPFWIITGDLNQQSSFFSNIQQLTYPWVSAISLKKKPGISEITLVKTTSQSWEQKGTFVLNPQTIPQPAAKDLKSFTVTADLKKPNGSEIVVIPSSRFALDQYLSQNTQNLEFILNILNELASSGALTGIRSRQVAFYPLPDLSTSQQEIFCYANILLLPLLFGVYGALRLMRRR